MIFEKYLIITPAGDVRVVTKKPKPTWGQAVFKLAIDMPDEWGEVMGTIPIQMPPPPPVPDVQAIVELRDELTS